MAGAAPSLTLEIVEGISEHANRVALKGVFTAFGDVLACWVPPIDRRGIDTGSVRFATSESANAAKQACDAGQVFFQGIPMKVKFRLGGGPRVGNSDIGGTVNNRSPSPERDKWTRGRGNQPERRRSRSRGRRRSRSRDRARGGGNAIRDRSRSRGDKARKKDRDTNSNRFGGDAAGDAQQSQLAPMNALPPPDYNQMMSMSSMGGYPGMGSMAQMPPVDHAAMAAQALADEKNRVEAQRKRLAATKRGPGVAALVQGALKKAQTLAQEKEEDRKRDPGERDDVQEVKSTARVETIDDLDDDKKQTKESKEARAARKAKAEREAQEQQERKERLEREAQEKREIARKKAEEEAIDRARQERETREARVKTGLETAKKHQAARERGEQSRRVGPDNLYGDMPNPDEQGEAELNEKRAREAALLQKNMDLGLPSEDRGKVVFLDIDGVLRPARAGGFDILTVDGAQAIQPDTSDFFPSAMKALRHIIERTGATIVLSSEWRRDESMRDAVDEKLAAHRLRSCSSTTRVDLDRALGSGDPVKSFAKRRAQEITSWLNQHEDEVKGWVVLDDINLSIADEDRKVATKAMTNKLVQTWPLCGLTMGNAKTAVRILNGEMIHKVLVERPKAPGGGMNTAIASDKMSGISTHLPH